MSSANAVTEAFLCLVPTISAIYDRKRTGDKTAPWGTPQVRSTLLDFSFPTFTDKVRRLRNDFIN
ncbi:unnamed protein product [Nezara viridula]|uniref:Uncharacterized protein n=1 Tax=Nezara viridula TaxID=85310 RepID=A0A9P0EBF8_NEZVI|nr:unnamed protein product [Nezara viridula]